MDAVHCHVLPNPLLVDNGVVSKPRPHRGAFGKSGPNRRPRALQTLEDKPWNGLRRNQ